ncbi:MAG: PKD domain-containing protein [Bacteroidota bacterium]
MKNQVLKALVPAILFCTIFSIPLLGQEICNNSIDDDGDGMVDFNDEDCMCEGFFQSGQIPESIIPNPSFEDMDCCPNSFGDLDCAVDWIQASDATSDFINTCNFMPFGVPLPMPDGNGCVGFHCMHTYKEYVGACLTEPFVAGEPYTLQMSIAANEAGLNANSFGPPQQAPLNITVFGSPHCTDLPFPTYLCPMNAPNAGDWEIIGEALYTPSDIWSTLEISLYSDVDINAVVIGPPCDLPASYPTLGSTYKDYFFVDNLILNQSALFSAQVSEQYVSINVNGDQIPLDPGFIDNNPIYGQYCFDEMVLYNSPDTTGDFQWYYEGVAIPNATDTTLIQSFNSYESGNYGFAIFIDDSTCSYASVQVGEPIYPIASMNVDQICLPDQGNLVSVPDGITTIVDHQWTIDGTFNYSGAAVSHYFEGHSLFQVKHIVQAENLCTDTIIEWYELPAFPEADFYFEDVCANELILLSDSSTIDFNGVLSTWTWDTPGMSSSGPDDTYSFSMSDPGTYIIGLEVMSEEGCSHSIEKELTIYPLPEADFSLTPICFSEPLAFFDNNSSISQGELFFNWNYGDGQSSADVNSVHLFNEPGFYNVQLLAESDFGCKDSIEHIQIVSEVISNFDFSNPAGCHPHNMEFNSTSSSSGGQLEFYRWIYSSGDSVYDIADQETFYNYGHEDLLFFDVSLFVEDEFGCTDQIDRNALVEVRPRPYAEFSYSIDANNPQYQNINFLSSSIGVDFFDWDLGNGEYSQEEHPNSYYKDGDTYAITLLVETEYGCLDTAEAVIEIAPANYVYIPNSFSPNADGHNDVFFPVVSGEVIAYQFDIYDRWGQNIFSSDEPEESWNGSIDANDYLVMSGIYTYQLHIQFKDDEPLEKLRGSVTVIR